MQAVKNLRVLSLSRGLLGEPFIAHEYVLGMERLQKLGVSVSFGEHAKKGMEYIQAHPEDRAKDLLAALTDPKVDMILCAIGGDDTYRLLPYLFENGELAQAFKTHRQQVEKGLCKPKIFLGFSDTTVNHFMLHKVGMPTFYGQSFLSDVCELSSEMLPYSRTYFEQLIQTGRISRVVPSDVWYSDRSDFSPAAVGTMPESHPNEGFELLQGSACFSGEILGGCIDTMHDFFFADRYPDTAELIKRYKLFPSAEEWEGKIVLIETSEERMSAEKYGKALCAMKQAGVFDKAAGVLIGKPVNEELFDEYKKTALRVLDNPKLPVVANINIGHATPRCILPFGKVAHVDAEAQEIRFE